ncbi:MAG: monooxygenase [Cyanobacteria bacterium P01_C01_bin.69]
MSSLTSSKHAVVIGGSMAGLLAAKVLSGYYEQVTIVERDAIAVEEHEGVESTKAIERKGVPQSPQPHILLTKGYRILKDFFPDIDQPLLAAGAVPIDWGQDFSYFSFGGWSASHKNESEIKSFSCTRPLLENVVRQQVEAIENVTRISPYRVDGLAGDANTVTGIRCTHRYNKSETRTLLADLVVDASGRSSNASQWLSDINSSLPTTDTVDARLGYATRRYKIPVGWEANWKVLLVGHEPPENYRLGYLAQVENNAFIATLGGYEQQYPPLDDEGFLAFARQLPASEFYDAIAHATPISPIKAYRSTANKLRRYDELAHMPSGFVALGDAVCALCPAYGQGLTTSGLSAIALQNWLDAATENSLTFQKDLLKSIKPSWDIATKSDSGFMNAKGRLAKSRIEKLMGRYMQRLITKTHTDSELNLTLTKISHMIESPIKLFSPNVLIKTFSKAP